MDSPEESGEFNADKLLNLSDYQNKRKANQPPPSRSSNNAPANKFPSMANNSKQPPAQKSMLGAAK